MYILGAGQKRRGSSEESLTGDDLDNDRHSLSINSAATTDDRAMMQLQRVASTTTVMMAMTTASTPGDPENDPGLLGSATTFTSDLRRFSVPSHNVNVMNNNQQIEHSQQIHSCNGSLNPSLQYPASSLALIRKRPSESYLSETSKTNTNESIVSCQGIGQSRCIAGRNSFYSSL